MNSIRFIESTLDDSPMSKTSGTETFGLYIVIPLSKKLSFQPEIYYTNKETQRKRSVYPYSPAIERTELRTWRFYYVEMPMLLKYRRDREHSFSPLLFAGPSFSILVDTWYTMEVPGTDIFSIEMDDKLKWFDYGLIVGGGFDLEIGEVYMVADLRFYYGLANVAHDSNETCHNIKNRGVYFLFGFQF